jgi:hypothetical protein
MHIDLYTKSVLTIIAISLVLLVAQNAVNSVRAATEMTKVQICDSSNGRCAAIGNFWERNVLLASTPGPAVK